VSFDSFDEVGTFAVENSWDVQVIVSDQFNSAIIQSTVATATIFQHWGIGLGVGKFWEQGGLDVAGQIYQNDGNAVLDESSGYQRDDLYTKTELNAGQLDTRYYTESELDAKFASSNIVGAQRVIPSSVAKAGGGTIVVDPDGTVRVSASGVTAISLNDVFEQELSYRIDILHFNSVNNNNLFRFRAGGADFTGATYVQAGSYHTGSWTTGVETVSGYGQVTNGGLLSVNGKTYSRTRLNLTMVGVNVFWDMQTMTRDGGGQTDWAATGDVSTGSFQSGFSLLASAGSFTAGTAIKIWRLK
jgi:hypothetical protein